MKTQRFGIEIEMTGLTRQAAAKVVANYFGTRENSMGGIYDKYEVMDTQSRTWKIVSDRSIRTERKNGGSTNDSYKVELVSPICKYEDIGTIQEIIRLLRKNGAIANSSCGIHIHIDAAPHTARSLKNIINIMASKEDLLFKALAVESNRANRWCKKVDTGLVERITRIKPTDKNQIRRAWYNGYDGAYEHYHDSRYHALNLHAVWQKGTVEFRCFNSTIKHAGTIKAYIQLCLAISHQALTQSCASAKKTQTTNEKYTFRTWLLRLGLIGDEYATAREHLLKNLTGDIAFKDNRRVA